jgi:hypothetical protein
MNRKDLERKIAERAWSDPKFLADLRRSPRDAIAAAFGIELPAGLKVVLHEETPDTIHLSLPVAPAAPASHQLDEAALDAVAGGGSLETRHIVK